MIAGVIIVRFGLAVFYNWTISRKLGKVLPPPPEDEDVYGAPLAPVVQRSAKNSPAPRRRSRYSVAYNLSKNTGSTTSLSQRRASSARSLSMYGSRNNSSSSLVSFSSYGSSAGSVEDLDGILRSILLVTCYSEGRDGLQITLDSLAATNFPDSHKLIFVVADGIITGAVSSHH